MTFHKLNTDIPHPVRFTWPFCYSPHPIALLACERVQRYIARSGLDRLLKTEGKMFGVLVATDKDGNTGFLAAYSGQIEGGYGWPYFVPPVYDLTLPDSHFKRGEAEISDINRRVEELEHGERRILLEERLAREEEAGRMAVEEARQRMDEAKRRRDQRRASSSLTDAEAEAMTRESQHLKAEWRRAKKALEERMATIRKEMEDIDRQIPVLKALRKRMSDELQRWIFDRYTVLNARGERRTLTDIFHTFRNALPPSGAGECCAPKLLQYAYLNGLHPLCMAEFWFGPSPKREVRRHLHFYPACRGKCLPILSHMLIGLDVDEDPLSADKEKKPLDIVYEDQWLAVVNKPAGMLSVPGKEARDSVYSIAGRMFPDAEGPLIVHRLDMDTSGLLVIAKTKEAHCLMQKMFAGREVRKTYVALLDGLLPPDMPYEGTIRLPLRPDPYDRPRQVADPEHGKPAVTAYRVLGEKEGHTLIELHPLTGRTHQLRVHCAHADGLDMPMLGDPLYGRAADRLYLHAEKLVFRHPFTSELLVLKSERPF